MTNTQPPDPGLDGGTSGAGPTSSAWSPPSDNSCTGGWFDQLRRLGVTRTGDGWVGGVCSGLARRLGIDPAIVRAGLIVLLLFGIGLLAYLIAWALLPDESGSIIAERAIRDGDGWGVFLLVVIAIAVLGTWVGDSRLWAGPVLTLGGLAALWYFFIHRPRTATGEAQAGSGSSPGAHSHAQPHPAAHDYPARQHGWADSTGPTPPPAAPPAWASGTASSVGYEPPPSHEQPATDHGHGDPRRDGADPRPKAPRAGVAGLLLVVGAIVIGAGIGLQLAHNVGIPPTLGGLVGATTLAGLATTLLGLLGRRSFVAGLASIVLAFSLVVTWGFGHLPTQAFGDQTWRPSAATEQTSYTWNLGSATLDLRQLTEKPDQGEFRADVSFGELVVYVPEGITTRINASARFGEVAVNGFNDASISESNSGTEVSRSYVFGAGEPALTVDASVRFGSLKIITTTDPTSTS